MSETTDKPLAATASGALRRPRILDPLPVSIGLALVFTVAGLLTLMTRTSIPTGYRADDAVLTALTVASGLALGVLWWSPLAALGLTVGLVVVQSALGYHYTDAALLTIVVCSFALVAFERWTRAFAGGFVVAAGFIAVVFTSDITWREAVTTWALLSIVWAAAGVLRLYRMNATRAERRAALFAADRDARAREAVAEERARLARELHDSVGHALNVVVLHAGAAQRVVDKRPELAREALGSIETVGRQALVDIERMLGVLRAGESESLDAAPGVGQLEVLCESVREAGLPVTLTVEGDRVELPSSVDLTAYRIVQEALTNTLKHAGDARARVRIRYGPGAVELDVEDNGRGTAAKAGGGGRGLVGMRERVAIFGGELQAGPRAEGGFAVHARLPLRSEG